jgi:hypothetical protein
MTNDHDSKEASDLTAVSMRSRPGSDSESERELPRAEASEIFLSLLLSDKFRTPPKCAKIIRRQLQNPTNSAPLFTTIHNKA